MDRLLDIPDLQIVQVNTDGVTVKHPRKYEEQYYSICKKWEEDVQLELEFANYKSMHIRDVNSYIAVYEE